MKKAVIYYSLEGNTEYVAKKIADEIGADIFKLVPEEEIAKKGIMKFVWGGKQAFMKEKPKLKKIDLDLSKYELLVIGTPVWAFTMSPAILSFLSEYKIENKKLALYSCHEGGKGKTLENIKKIVSENIFIGETDFKNALENIEITNKKVEDFIKKIS